MRQLLCPDHWDGVLVLGAEAALHVQDLAGLTNGLANVAKSVSNMLEATHVLSDVHVTLDKVSELGL